VNNNVLIFVHKEQELDDIAQHFSADHYVMVDDKLRIRRQKNLGLAGNDCRRAAGHHALDPEILQSTRQPDVSIERIGDLLNYDLQNFTARVAKVTGGSV
jgi:hypothetical protein